jgi:flavin-binding protein dodecin
MVGGTLKRIRFALPVVVARRLAYSEKTMSGSAFRKTEIVGVSPTSVSNAIDIAVARGTQTLRNVDWFEVGEIRGQVKDGKVSQYPVTLKVGFRLE